MDAVSSSSSERYGTATLYGSIYSEKLAGIPIGEVVTITLKGFLRSVSGSSVDLEVKHCEVEDAQSFEDAADRALLKHTSRSVHSQPYPG